MQLLSSSDALVALLAKLGYDTNERLVQNVAAMGFSSDKGDTSMLQVRVRDAAEDHNMTQSELAQAVGMSTQSMSKYWRGNRIRRVDLDKLEEIANVLGVPALSLLKETED